MLGTQSFRRLTVVVAGVMLLAICIVPVAFADYLNGIVFYVPSSATDYDQIAERYDLGLVGRENGAHAAQVRHQNPEFRWYVYNSLTDNYVSGIALEEDQILTSIAEAAGVDPEEAYLHYYDDTVIELGGTDVFIPGWGGGSAATKKDARLPVYYSTQSRAGTNFSTPEAMHVQLKTIVNLLVDRAFPNTNLYADGVFFDNAASRFWNTGKVKSGGHVLETPGHLRVDSAEMSDWHWNQNIGPFLGALKDTLATSASWGHTGRRIEIMNNVANSWTEDFAGGEVSDILFMEFQYGPVRNAGAGQVMRAFERDLAANLNGTSSFYAALPTLSASGYDGSYTLEEAMYGNLAWYLVSRTSTSILFQATTFNTSKPDFGELTWIGAMDVADAQLGEAVGPPYMFATGTDALGYPYEVVARNYDNGLALVRNRGRWNEHITAQTNINLTLPGSLFPIAINGSVGSEVSVWSLRNGEGAVFLGDASGGGGGGGGGDDPPPTGDEPDPPTDLAGSFRVLATSPAQGADSVPVGAEVRFLLTDALPSGSIPSGWIIASGSVTGIQSGSILVEQGNRLVFRTGPWYPGETVTVQLSPLAYSAAGVYVDGNLDGEGSGQPEDGMSLSFQILP